MASPHRSPLFLPVDWPARMAEAQALAAAGGALSRRIGVAALAGFARAAAASPVLTPMARLAAPPSAAEEDGAAPRLFSRRRAEAVRAKRDAA